LARDATRTLARDATRTLARDATRTLARDATRTLARDQDDDGAGHDPGALVNGASGRPMGHRVDQWGIGSTNGASGRPMGHRVPMGNGASGRGPRGLHGLGCSLRALHLSIDAFNQGGLRLHPTLADAKCTAEARRGQQQQHSSSSTAAAALASAAAAQQQQHWPQQQQHSSSSTGPLAREAQARDHGS
jgi:hypothetical protein